LNTIDIVDNPFLNPNNQETDKPNYMAVMTNEWYIYGNSTHGRFARAFPYVSAQVNEGGYINDLYPEKLYQSRRLRLKEYELKDHLGNVRAVVSDFKNKVDTMTTNPPFKAEVLAVYNYYPFGMLQPGMYAENNNRRTHFGFNGMLRDDDVKDKLQTPEDEGRGNSYATHYRLYDPRVTRWFSIDPLVAQFPWTSPYTGMGNNPVSRIDPMGDADYISTDLTIINDGVDDGLKYALDKNLLPDTKGEPPSIQQLKTASIILPDKNNWETIVKDIYKPISPYNNQEDIGAYGIKASDITYRYGGKSEPIWDNRGIPGQDGTKATLKAVEALGNQDFKVAVHSHPHWNAQQYSKDGTKLYRYGLDSQQPHPYDYSQLWRTGAQAGMVITKDNVFLYRNTKSSIMKFDFEELNKKIKDE